MSSAAFALRCRFLYYASHYFLSLSPIIALPLLTIFASFAIFADYAFHASDCAIDISSPLFSITLDD
jgi:hypothetical protein